MPLYTVKKTINYEPRDGQGNELRDFWSTFEPGDVIDTDDPDIFPTPFPVDWLVEDGALEAV